jgi:beta-glucosidase
MAIYSTAYFRNTHLAGVDEINNENLPLQEALIDYTRIEFYQQHIFYVQKALR